MKKDTVSWCLWYLAERKCVGYIFILLINIMYFLLNNLIPNRIPNKDFKKCRLFDGILIFSTSQELVSHSDNILSFVQIVPAH